jgi:hypothetical protein
MQLYGTLNLQKKSINYESISIISITTECEVLIQVAVKSSSIQCPVARWERTEVSEKHVPSMVGAGEQAKQ